MYKRHQTRLNISHLNSCFHEINGINENQEFEGNILFFCRIMKRSYSLKTSETRGKRVGSGFWTQQHFAEEMDRGW